MEDKTETTSLTVWSLGLVPRILLVMVLWYTEVMQDFPYQRLGVVSVCKYVWQGSSKKQASPLSPRRSGLGIQVPARFMALSFSYGGDGGGGGGDDDDGDDDDNDVDACEFCKTELALTSPQSIVELLLPLILLILTVDAMFVLLLQAMLLYVDMTSRAEVLKGLEYLHDQQAPPSILSLLGCC